MPAESEFPPWEHGLNSCCHDAARGNAHSLPHFALKCINQHPLHCKVSHPNALSCLALHIP